MSLPTRLRGKVAVITASTDGIGYAIAERLGREGARVVVSSRKQHHVDGAVKQLTEKGIEVTGIVCHVGKAEDRERLLKTAADKFGGIDILVSNVGVSPYFGPFIDTTEKVWDTVFDINVKSTFLLVQSAVRYMRQRGGGNIVINSSVGAYRSEQMIGAYSVSKTALLGLTRTLAESLAAENVRVNCIAPGVIKTRLSEMLWKNPDTADLVNANCPMKRFAEPHECAGAVAFLVSDDASYITGETIVMAGGTYARL